MTNTKNRWLNTWVALGAVFAAATASAQGELAEDQSRRVGDFEIYYSAVPIEQLPEQISKRYNLQREANAAMLQVTVRRNANGSDSAVKAAVTGTAKSLAGKPVDLEFIEHADTGSPLYIAEFKLTRPDTFIYTLHVSADGLPEQEITFQRDYAPN